MELFIILFLILLNGIFSMTEIAVVSAKKVRLEAAVKRGSSSAKTALEIAAHPNRFLSTVQIGITLIGILTGLFSGDTVTQSVAAWIQKIPVLAPYANSLAVFVTVMTLTYFAIVLGELVPKRIGMTHPETIAKLFARPMHLLSIAVAPFVGLLSVSSDFILKLLRIKSNGSAVTEEEIKAMVQESTDSGEIQQIEQEIVERVFNLGDRKVASLMTHKSDLIMLHVQSSAAQIREAIGEGMHSYYPVYEEDNEDIIGMVALKDLVDQAMSGSKHINIRDFLQPAHWVSSSTNVYQLLTQFKEGHTKHSLITDEYGHAMGMISMSDIAESLVGSVDEMYKDEFSIDKREDGSILVDGLYSFHDFLRHFDIDEYASEYDINTMGGLVLEEMGRIPSAGEWFIWHQFRIEVVDVDGAKIDKLLIRERTEAEREAQED